LLAPLTGPMCAGRSLSTTLKLSPHGTGGTDLGKRCQRSRKCRRGPLACSFPKSSSP
jgi:hypothetical protein